MAIRYDTEAGEFEISPEYCPDCEEPRYDTGCDAPGCDGRACFGCGTGCDNIGSGMPSRCRDALDAEPDEDYDARVDAERAAFGLAPLAAEEGGEGAASRG